MAEKPEDGTHTEQSPEPQTTNSSGTSAPEPPTATVQMRENNPSPDDAALGGRAVEILDKETQTPAAVQKKLADRLSDIRCPTYLTVGEMGDVIDESLMNFIASDVNIAVCGRSGVGKSSLINCILNLRPTDEGAARVGTTECTAGIVGYKHTNLPRVVVWDLPGVGTNKYTREKYLETVKFSSFDAFIIVCGNRIYEDDTWLAKEAGILKKPFHFVRSKIDEDLQNAWKDYGRDYDSTMKDMRENAQKCLNENDIEHGKIYMISSRLSCQSEWDFPSLMEDLVNRIPKNVTALVMAMVNCSKEIIAKKKDHFHRRIHGTAIKALKTHDSFQQIIMGEILLYVQRFGIGDENLRKWQIEVGNLEPKYQNIKKGITDVVGEPESKKSSWDFHRFLHRVSMYPLFKNREWAKKIAEKGEQKCDTESTYDELFENIRHLLESALADCDSLALRVLEERHNVAKLKVKAQIGHQVALRIQGLCRSGAGE